MPSWYATPNDELAALARAVSRAGCQITSLEIGQTPDGPHAIGQLECRTGWRAARLLVALMVEDSKSPGGRRLAAELRRIAPGDGDFARLVHTFVKKRVRFQREKGEVFTGGGYTLAVGFGDCDDHARLAGALALAGGLPTRLAFLHAGKDPKHVLAQLGVAGVWQWAETTIDARFAENPLAAVERLGIAQGRTDIAREVVTMSEQDLNAPPPDYVGKNPPGQVKLDSEALSRLGYLDPAACDAGIGDPTDMTFRRAVLAFQLATGITPDGLDGRQTRAALAAALPPDEFGQGYRQTIGAIEAATPPATIVPKHTADLTSAFFQAVWAMWQDFKAKGATLPPEAFLNVWSNESNIKASSHLQDGTSVDRQGHLIPMSKYFKFGYSGLNGMGTQERKVVGAPWDPVPVTPDSPGYLEWIGMSEEAQVPFVKTFTEMNVRSFAGGNFGKLTNAGALYLLNFLPAYFGHADDPSFVLAQKGGHNDGYYVANAGLDVGQKGYIEVADMERVMAMKRGDARYLEAKARLYAEGGGQAGGTLPPGALGLGPILAIGAALGAAAVGAWKVLA